MNINEEVKKAADVASRMYKAGLHEMGLCIHIAAGRHGVNKSLVAKMLAARGKESKKHHAANKQLKLPFKA